MVRIRRTIVGVAWALAGTIILAACAPAPPASAPAPSAATSEASKAPAAAQASFPLTITDDAGRQVTVEQEPQRIVSLAPSNTEILFALGLGDKVVGVTTYCDYPEEAKAKPKIGSLISVDYETLLASAPDLILATTTQAKRIVPELEAKGLAVVVIDPTNLEDVLAKIRLVGRLTGRADEAQALVEKMDARVRETQAKLATAKTSPRVFWEVTRELISPGPSSFIGDMIVRAGGTNIVADTSIKWPRLSQEVIIASDPEVIIVGDHAEQVTPAEIAARPGWQTISAVKAGRMVPVDPNVVNRAGPRIVDGFELVARAIHPEVFQ
ncbi:MAG TPA: cobalamin-binding protein [Dehalococcoidia bacterium]|nr:cobalamin-binding protein [Dehalococcoidia bacterium]